MLVVSPLPHPWTLRADPAVDDAVAVPARVAGAEFAAQVPGCVHTDLLAARAIADPYVDDNEKRCAWIGRTDWSYRTRLPAAEPEFERTDLVFEGLDTFATVSVGGRPLGETANMHRRYRFDVSAPTAGGAADLVVAFASAYRVAEALKDELGARPNAYPEPFNYVRKMASSFGWDWGPTLVTAGIWRPVRIERWSTARLDSVAPQVTVVGGDGRVRVEVGFERTAAGGARELRLDAAVAGVRATVAVPAGAARATVELDVPAPELWWPHTLGAQPLHALTVDLADADTGEPLDNWSRRIGFRTVELDTAEDEGGSAFRFVVNGVPVFTRGVNWIPDDALVSRMTADRYRERLAQAKEANVDLVRVWGGGIYEDAAFYDACDELGLMVWQDFLFACAAYPEEGPLPAEIEAEARDNVVRLMPHASLVLWNGNNENLWGHEDWAWKEELAGASWGRGYYLDLLPRVVAELDPTRPYWAGSPWSGSEAIHPNDARHGTAHRWEEWNRRPYTDYLADVPRFVAEFGWQAPPAMATITQSVHDRPLGADSPGMLHHQKAEDGNGKLLRGLAPVFGEPRSFDEWHYLTQLNQARAVATGVEHWRANWPTCAGTVLWQLNDCWPVTSWAAVDSYGRRKPLFHELRRLYADRLLTFQQGEDSPRLVAVNQAARPWTAVIELRRVHADGSVAGHAVVRAEVAPRGVSHFPVPAELLPLDGHKEFLVGDCDGLRALWFGAADKDFAYPRADFSVEVVRSRQETRVEVTAHSLVRDLLLQADRLHPDAETDQGRVTLLPGERAVFRVTGWPAPNGEAANAQAASAALFCVNGGS
ncbi:glycoside hydrolase family 2 protein [Streptomyces sp. NBC_00448]|uniref:glycoside hydrolase family 2 protein n=1 Tax=Streptomyces sp. NBC_00448 TaxID=2903652 RepID=UPI002E217C9B